MSTHVCFTFFLPRFIQCQQMTEPLRLPPRLTTTVATTTTTLPASTTTRSRPTTRSRIGGSRAGGPRLSIVDFILPRLCEGYLSLCNSLYSDSDASADACMHRAYVFEPSRPWLV